MGITFYYWDRYESDEYYVAKKYDTFKEEICEYDYLSINDYQNTIIPKITQYINTNKAKQTIFRAFTSGCMRYGVVPGSEVSFNHLLALCLYTDFSDLCTDFSKSFRRIDNYESLESVKVRNRNYHFMGKYLRECVELFGDYNHKYSNNKLQGPFYSGLSFVAKFDFTDISLCAPTSTSREAAVAHRFTGDGHGILIEFANHIHELRGFSCEWISQYKEESEVLFMGGSNRIRIIGVTIMNTKPKPKTYQIYFHVLAKFIDMIYRGKSNDWTNSERSLICDLIDWKLNNKHNPNIDQYIYDSFGLFLNNKSIISMRYAALRESEPQIREKIMPKIQVNDDIEIDPFSNSYSTNSFRFDVILSLFKNLESIHIYDAKEYKFSLSYLLSSISTLFAIPKIIIHGVSTEKYWIHRLWNNHGDKLLSMFNQHQFDIDYYNGELLITGDVKDPYFYAITKFDDMLSGNKSIGWTKSQRSVISDLMDYKIDEEHTSNIDGAIIDSFEAFINNKLEIRLVYWDLNESDSEMVNKLMYKMENKDIDFDSASDSTNLFRGDNIFKIFKNLQSIVIWGGCQQEFSVRYMLSVIIESCSLQTITINGVDDDHWIYFLWNTNKDKLISMFNQHQFDIKYDDELIIRRQ